ncbi:MAG: carboxypeptidase-like regulatory domain-containing protein [Ferruginibacter sp.]
MRHIILLATLLLTGLFSFAQKGKIEGKITDSKSGNKISAVTVLVVENNTSVAADIDGHFSISLDAGKKYSLKISSVGYKTKVIDEIEIQAGQTVNLDIILEPAAKTEQVVEVRASARKGNHQRLDCRSEKYTGCGSGDQRRSDPP